MKDGEVLYNSKVDSIYIPIYRLGGGTSAKIWFAVELKNFIKNVKNNRVDVDYKALKIFRDFETHEWFREIEIHNLFKLNGKHSNNINYPNTFFTTEDEYNIVVYDVCMCSLYDLYENNSVPKESLNSIIQQMKDSIQFIHECGYIHTDVKLENFLICGYTKKQKQFKKFVDEYNFKNLFNCKIRGGMNIDTVLSRVDSQLEQFKNFIYKKMNILEKKKKDDEDDDESDYDDYDTESDMSYITDEENHLSYDKFHIKEFDNKEDDSEEKEDKNMDFIVDDEYLKNPLVKLADFGLIKKEKFIGSAYPRINRPPETILGLVNTYKSDLWALGLSIYELVNGQTIFKFQHDSIYGSDLFHIKTFMELFYDNNEHKDLIKLIKKSERKDYFLSKSDTLLFCKTLNKLDKNYDYCKDLLHIDPEKRHM